jgi:hypothetical protein
VLHFPEADHHQQALQIAAAKIPGKPLLRDFFARLLSD